MNIGFSLNSMTSHTNVGVGLPLPAYVERSTDAGRPTYNGLKHRRHALAGYEEDFSKWALHQAKLLREKRFHEPGLENLIEEVESLSRQIEDEVERHLEPLLAAMIRWNCFKKLRCMNWQEKIGEHRAGNETALHDDPNVDVPELIDHLWGSAVLEVHKAMGLNFDLMPKTCPWTVKQVLSIKGYYLPDEEGWRELPHK